MGMCSREHAMQEGALIAAATAVARLTSCLASLCADMNEGVLSCCHAARARLEPPPCARAPHCTTLAWVVDCGGGNKATKIGATATFTTGPSGADISTATITAPATCQASSVFGRMAGQGGQT